MGDVRLKPYGSDSVSSADAIKRRRNELWNNLNRYIRECGGHVVSLPNATPLRVEIAQNSNLPTQLMDAGYSVHLGERVTRIGGAETFTVADVLWIDLPKVH
jgi:hypothetical protein